MDDHPMIRKIESVAVIGEEERQMLRGLTLKILDFDKRTDIVSEGDRPTQSCLVINGFSSRFKQTADGRRQILGFHVPGDIPDLQSLHLHTMDHTLATVSACRLAFISHKDLLDLTARSPRLAEVLWRTTLIDAAIQREWTFRVGQRSALERTAHLLCELLARLDAVGLANDARYSLPITQLEMADALGLTNVSVNRMLVHLRRENLVRIEGRALTVIDRDGLVAVAEFDPEYLHLRRRETLAAYRD